MSEYLKIDPNTPSIISTRNMGRLDPGEHGDTESTVKANQNLQPPKIDTKPDSYGPKKPDGSYDKWCSEC